MYLDAQASTGKMPVAPTRRVVMKSLIVIAGVVFSMFTSTALAAGPQVGDKAPDFELAASDGKTYKLSEFAGKKPVVIAWFPKAFTRGCTAECKNMKENGAAIRKFDVAYFTASVDDVKLNTEFAKSLELDFPILSDPTKKTAEAYGVINPQRGMANRWTFYIGADGKIKAIDQKVNAAKHSEDIVKQLEALGVPKKS
jgi:peroxiredoxin Q/BCP